ncbi:MAG: alpha amylase C-terminal domain-containing protein [Magnetococcales bacterium]|nr:alpha amylase C-terminal domain-containing protein [Magnetococcales bacterium]
MKLGAQLTGAAGCTFRVWAPFAQKVSVVGEFNAWKPGSNSMRQEKDGIWFAHVPEARAEQEYRFYIEGPTWNPDFKAWRPDPWSRQMVCSVGPSIIKDKNAFQWTDHNWSRQYTEYEDLVIYELHVGAFIGRNDTMRYPGNFRQLISKLDYLKNLGVNTIELLPINEYYSDYFLGYAPVAFFPIESSLGSGKSTTYDDFKALVDASHNKGLAVIADVVFNHFTDQGNWDNEQWMTNFDGDTRYGRGGIYLSGEKIKYGPAPDWSNPMVEKYVEEACRFYLEELHVDGLRWDLTNEISNKTNGWEAMRRIVWNLKQSPWGYGRIFIAEHHDYSRDVVESGNFDSGWFVDFHHIMERSFGGRGKDGSIEHAINGGNYSRPHKRLVYAMSHDEARNGGQYLVGEFGGRDSWASRAKARALGALTFFIPGIPMIWQGEELLQQGHFANERDLNCAMDWGLEWESHGSATHSMYRDAIAIRRNFTALRYGDLAWPHPQDGNGVLAFRRRDCVNGQEMLVVVNLGGANWSESHGYGVATGSHGQWRQVFCSQDASYGGWDHAGNAFYEPWTQGDGRIYVNMPKYSVMVFLRTQ